jgi:lipoprotein-anchoring transpeptidase ErfK/SrfK
MNRDILEKLKANQKAQALPHEPVNAPSEKPSRKHSRLFWPLIVLLGLFALSLAGWSAVSNPALASILSNHPTATSAVQVVEQFWAKSMIAKPTYTPTALPVVILPTQTPQELVIPEIPTEVTATPGVMVAEIVPDTPTPEYAAQTNEETAPAISYSGAKYILVDISEQHMYVYENDVLVYSFVASTGMNNATKVGTFAVQSKIPSAYGSTWDIWMPYWLGIYWAGGSENGIHALPILSNGGILWEGFLGRPISYGCVVLGTYEAELLYNWAEYGTPVDIQW